MTIPSTPSTPPTQHTRLLKWIEEVIQLCEPKEVHWCNGSQEEADKLFREMEAKGSCIALHQKKHPNSYLFRSEKRDVARVEKRTFICTKDPSQAGPTNHWEDPNIMRAKLAKLFKGCMKGRKLYVVPFCMGHLGSNFSRIGVQLTDTPYAVVNMRVMAHTGSDVLTSLGDKGDYIPCLHSVGCPLKPDEKDVPWACDPDNTYVVHFPDEEEIMSFGSGYGGNALLGKKCLALRIASVLGKKEGWLAEHMLILGIESPEGKKHYIAAAFPSGCGKTNFAMMMPPTALGAYRITCVGDDIAWLTIGKDGRLWAVNPESGFFGVASGTSRETNPHALACCEKNAIFTNVALTKDGSVWWEGLSTETPTDLIDWQGNPHTGKEPAAHPNSRFTVPAHQCPVADEKMNDPEGVPIDAIIFGGRREKDVPLVFEALSWEHGVYLGATMGSEQTAAAEGTLGKLRRDPMAMLPFCGYHIADYFKHWLDVGANLSNPPNIFHVNWFRKNEEGKFLWSGFGENIRVLDWIVRRIEGTTQGHHSALGQIPHYEDFCWKGLPYPKDKWEALMAISPEKVKKTALDDRAFFESLGKRFPEALKKEHLALLERLKS